jgi:hypothetical protein
MRDQENTSFPDFAVDDLPSSNGSEPVDVVQVRADEALISALSASVPPSIDDPVDDRLANLLWSWREDVESPPNTPLVDPDTAAAVLASAPRPQRRHNPFGPFAAAAAVFVLAFIGLGLAAEDARPGDTLWNVTRVLYAEKAKSVEAATVVRTKLDEATRALDSGNTAEAKVALQEARTKLPAVAPEDGKDDLATKTEQLLAVVDSTTPQPSTSTSTAGPPTQEPATPQQVVPQPAAPTTTTTTTVPQQQQAPAPTVPPTTSTESTSTAITPTPTTEPATPPTTPAGDTSGMSQPGPGGESADGPEAIVTSPS